MFCNSSLLPKNRSIWLNKVMNQMKCRHVKGVTVPGHNKVQNLLQRKLANKRHSAQPCETVSAFFPFNLLNCQPLILFRSILFLIAYICGCDCCSRACRCPQRGQKRAADPLELELQEVVGCPLWELGTELIYPTRRVYTFH